MNGEQQLETLFRTFQLYIDGDTPAAERTCPFTVDGAAWNRVTPVQRAVLMALAPPEIRYLNSETGDRA